jgi:hypothetical protein
MPTSIKNITGNDTIKENQLNGITSEVICSIVTLAKMKTPYAQKALNPKVKILNGNLTKFGFITSDYSCIANALLRGKK